MKKMTTKQSLIFWFVFAMIFIITSISLLYFISNQDLSDKPLFYIFTTIWCLGITSGFPIIAVIALLFKIRKEKKQ